MIFRRGNPLWLPLTKVALMPPGVVKKKSIGIEKLIPFLFLIVAQIPRGIKMVSTSLLKFNQICFFFTTPDAAYPDNLSACDKKDKGCIQVHRIKYTFGWIMKCVRNWGAHTTLFDKLTESEVAFFFIVAMRAMFKLSDNTQAYENILLNLFDK
ncbi:hypothetical protein PN36_26115 [Candidatus Thiomargarita nelsonii]|uniref:Uncharacterized protein n=1 Tax=Candidatus Thiomargarita nelsonii TaxID=1003181 RepID=A0A4E0QLY2_9GAMM|nr:hypothetical protein PN36_26115 [Candidatus Thiomargarita nelsonii]